LTLPRRGQRRRLIVPRGSLADGDPPFAALEHLDAGRHRGRHVAALLFALAAHGSFGIAAALQHAAAAHPPPAPVHAQIQATLQRPPAPLPEAKPPPPPPPPPRKPEARAAHATRSPPAPAQAGHVIAQAPAPTGPADLTGFDLVVGQGESYAGGYSSAQGTSKKAVDSSNAVVGGVPDAVQDLSRPATPLRRDWACSWPEEAQDSDLREARVTIRVSVGADGAPAKIEVPNAPPGGFADAARRCAEHEMYRPALDATGKPISADTHLFNVHFIR
jgi:protein TonB